MKEWTGAIVVFVIVCALAIAFMKVGLPLIERTMSTMQQHNARL